MATAESRRSTEPKPLRHRLRRGVPDPGRLAAVRADVRRFLADHGVPPLAVDSVVLVLTELATNGREALGARGGTVTVDVDCSRRDVVSVLVTNRPPGWPAGATLAPIVMPDSDAERGRGLPLVAALATRVSVDTTDRCTRVRADFAR